MGLLCQCCGRFVTIDHFRIESRGKRSVPRWHVYQHRQPDATEVAEWFRRWPDANIAIRHRFGVGSVTSIALDAEDWFVFLDGVCL
jgi:hypothetical protein